MIQKTISPLPLTTFSEPATRRKSRELQSGDDDQQDASSCTSFSSSLRKSATKCKARWKRLAKISHPMGRCHPVSINIVPDNASSRRCYHKWPCYERVLSRTWRAKLQCKPLHLQDAAPSASAAAPSDSDCATRAAIWAAKTQPYTAVNVYETMYYRQCIRDNILQPFASGQQNWCHTQPSMYKRQCISDNV